MVTIIFVAGFILTILFLKKKRDIEKHSIKKGFSYYFYKNSLEFLIPLVIVTLFYLLLSVLATIASEVASLQFLIKLEDSLEKFKSYFSIFKLNPIQVLIVFIILYLLSILRILTKKSKLFNFFDKYQSFMRRIYIVLVLLCSFTLLGIHFGMPTNDLNVRIKTIRDGYAEIYKDTQEAVSEEIASRIYSKALNSFPSSYHEALFSFPEKIEVQINSLSESYQSAQSRYGIKDRNIEAIINIGKSQIGKPSELKTKNETADQKITKKIQFAEPDPEQISYRKVKNAKKTLNQYKSSLQPKLIKLLKIEGGNKIANQIPQVFTYEIKEVLFRQIIESYPILEAVIDVFGRTIDKGLEEEVDKAVNRATNAIVQVPENLDKVFNQEVVQIVENKRVEVLPEDVNKAAQVIKQLENQVATMAKAKERIDQIEIIQINKLIGQLRSPNEKSSINASVKLASLGDKLSKSQVDEIVNIMRHGNNRWSKFAYRDEGSHCSWYDKISVKYYAGDSLEKMNSPHVSGKIKEEARDAMNNGKSQERVTDPGWI